MKILKAGKIVIKSSSIKFAGFHLDMEGELLESNELYIKLLKHPKSEIIITVAGCPRQRTHRTRVNDEVQNR